MTETLETLVRLDPWDTHDPLPWAWAVVQDGKVISNGWSPTEAEANVSARSYIIASEQVQA